METDLSTDAWEGDQVGDAKKGETTALFVQSAFHQKGERFLAKCLARCSPKMACLPGNTCSKEWVAVGREMGEKWARI